MTGIKKDSLFAIRVDGSPLVKKEEPDYVTTFPCGRCDGTGKSHGFIDSCIRCHGSGVVDWVSHILNNKSNFEMVIECAAEEASKQLRDKIDKDIMLSISTSSESLGNKSNEHDE